MPDDTPSDGIPDPRYWYMHPCDPDDDKVTIYDGDDWAVMTVESREPDEDFCLCGFTARELALRILKAVGAKKPIQD